MVILTRSHSRPLKPHTYNICNIGTDLRKSSSVQTHSAAVVQLNEVVRKADSGLTVDFPSSTVCE